MEVQQILYIGRVVDIRVVRGKWRLLLSREACVFLKPVTSELSWFVDESTAVILKEKLALKSLDVVDETRHLAVKKVKQPGIGTRETMTKQPRLGPKDP